MWRKKFQDQKSNHWSIWLLDHRAWKLHQHESEFSMITQSEWRAITDSLFKNLTRCRKSGDISSHNIEHFMNWRFKITVKWIPVYVWFVCLRGDLFVQRRRCYKRQLMQLTTYAMLTLFCNIVSVASCSWNMLHAATYRHNLTELFLQHANSIQVVVKHSRKHWFKPLRVLLIEWKRTQTQIHKNHKQIFDRLLKTKVFTVLSQYWARSRTAWQNSQ